MSRSSIDGVYPSPFVTHIAVYRARPLKATAERDDLTLGFSHESRERESGPAVAPRSGGSMFLLKRLASLGFALAVLAVVVPRLLPTSPVSSTVAVRGVYGRDASANGLDTIKATGFNTVTVQPYRSELDKLHAAGMRGLVWLWGYDGDTCSFSASDATIRDYVAAIAGHPAIAAYQVDDEPNNARTHGCPDVAAQIKARTQLLHSIDPSKPTYVVVSTWDGVETYPYQHFAGTTDIMGIDVYPFAITGIHLSMITSAIAEADKDGVTRYWAILQDFDDGYYRLPSAEEVQQQFDRWLPSRMEGYFVYHWGIANLDTLPDHLAVYSKMNALLAGGIPSTPSPSLAPSSSPAPSPTLAPSASPTPAPTPTFSPPPVLDTTPPGAPEDLRAVWMKPHVRITWSPSSDNVGVVGYRVYRDGLLLKTTKATSLNDRPTPNETHVYRLVAVDSAGNVSDPAEAVLAPIPTPAHTPSKGTSSGACPGGGCSK
jgi:hypothetical protein